MAQTRAQGIDIRVLEEKEVLFDFNGEGLIDKATGTFVGSWLSGGYEPAGSTWSLTRTVNSTDTDLTGGQTATSYTPGPVTSTAELIPGSPALDYIEWPDSVVQDDVTYRKHNAKVAKGFVARVHRFQSGIVGIMVTRELANNTVSDRGTANDPAGRSVTTNWKNGSDEVMAEEMYYRIGEDDTVTQVVPKRFVDVADLQTQIDAGTAFKSDAAPGALTAMVPVQTDGIREYADESVDAPVDGGTTP